MTPVQVLRVAARCPTCNAPPAIRTPPDVPSELSSWDPERVVITYQCSRRIGRVTCGTVYEIRAKDFQYAHGTVSE